MERPPARPEGSLIRRAREAAGLSIPEAVRRSGVSKARWSQVETGYETRDGTLRVVQARAGTLARMANAVGVTAERLETEGARPDAAEILREISRRQNAMPRQNLDVNQREDDPGPVTVLVLDPDDPVELAIWGQDKAEETKMRELYRWKVQQGKLPPPDQSDTG